jgi:6-phosphogluconolactonase
MVASGPKMKEDAALDHETHPMHRLRLTGIIATLFAATFAALSITLAGQTGTSSSARSDMLVYFGTYTGAKSQGVYVSHFDADSGALSPPELAAATANPSFLALHPGGGFLYAVNEVGSYGGKASGAVTAFAIDRNSGKLSALNQQPTQGADPAHLVVDRSGRDLLVANYSGGSVAVLPIEKDGRLKPASAFIQHTGSSVNAQRQKGPHPHSIVLDPTNRFAYVADLGLDKLLIYRFDAATGSLAANDPPFAPMQGGAGPRHLAMHPTGRFTFVINELRSTVTAFGSNGSRGGLTELQTISSLPVGQAVLPGFSTAELMMHPSGKFLYGSNRGDDSIVVFAVDEKSGRLTHVQNEPTQGSTPRGFGIDPSGTYLLAANQKSDSVVVFRIDTRTGRITPTGNKIDVGAPVCVTFVPARSR